MRDTATCSIPLSGKRPQAPGRSAIEKGKTRDDSTVPPGQT